MKEVGALRRGELRSITEGAAFQEAALGGGRPRPGRPPHGRWPAHRGPRRRPGEGRDWVDLASADPGLDPREVGELVAAPASRAVHGHGRRGPVVRRPGRGAARGAGWSRRCAPGARRSPAELGAMRPRAAGARGVPGRAATRRCGPVIATCGPTTCAARRTADCACSTSTTPASPTRRASSPPCSSSTPITTSARAARSARRVRGTPAAPAASRRRATSRWSSRSCSTSWRRPAGDGWPSTTDEARADNEGWVREFLDRPRLRGLVEALLAAR